MGVSDDVDAPRRRDLRAFPVAVIARGILTARFHVWIPKGRFPMADVNQSDVYRGFIACLNRQDWATLEHFVANDLKYNDKQIGLSGYRKLLTRFCDEIPDVYFELAKLVSQPPLLASRLVFNCTPRGTFLGLPVRGKRISFAENAIYVFQDDRIREVWSVLDKTAIEAQL
jgi:predicted ester cyclase